MEATHTRKETQKLSLTQPELPPEILNEIFSYSTLADKAVLVACSKYFSQILQKSIYHSLTFNEFPSSLKSAGLLFRYTPTPRYNGPWEYCTDREKRVDYQRVLNLDSRTNIILSSLQHPIFYHLKHLTLPTCNNNYSELIRIIFSPTSFFRRTLESFTFIQPSPMISRDFYRWKEIDMADWILQSLRMINLHQNQWSLFHRLEKEEDEFETEKEREIFFSNLFSQYYVEADSDWLRQFYIMTGSGSVRWYFYYQKGSGSAFNHWIAHNYLVNVEQPRVSLHNTASFRHSRTTNSERPLPRLTPDPFWSQPDSFEKLRVLKIGITPLTGLRIIRSIFRTNMCPSLAFLTLYVSTDYNDDLQSEEITTFLDHSDWQLMRYACQYGTFEMTVDWSPQAFSFVHYEIEYQEMMSLDRSPLDEEELAELDFYYVGPGLTILSLIMLEDSLISLIDIVSCDEVYPFCN